jgi:putative endonuclease
MFHNRTVGKRGEDIATEYLLKKGFTILTRNFSTRYGELDIIAKKDNKISFVEVKTRSSTAYGQPYEAITPRKVHHLKYACELYLLKNKIKDCKLSLDGISILLNLDGSVREIRHLENIF